MITIQEQQHRVWLKPLGGRGSFYIYNKSLLSWLTDVQKESINFDRLIVVWWIRWRKFYANINILCLKLAAIIMWDPVNLGADIPLKNTEKFMQWFILCFQAQCGSLLWLHQHFPPSYDSPCQQREQEEEPPWLNSAAPTSELVALYSCFVHLSILLWMNQK